MVSLLGSCVPSDAGSLLLGVVWTLGFAPVGFLWVLSCKAGGRRLLWQGIAFICRPRLVSPGGEPRGDQEVGAAFWKLSGVPDVSPFRGGRLLTPTAGKPHVWFVNQDRRLFAERISPAEAKPRPWLCCLRPCLGPILPGRPHWAGVRQQRAASPRVRAKPAACLGDRPLEMALGVTLPRRDRVQGARGELGNPNSVPLQREAWAAGDVGQGAGARGELRGSLGAAVCLLGLGAISSGRRLLSPLLVLAPRSGAGWDLSSACAARSFGRWHQDLAGGIAACPRGLRRAPQVG